MDTARSWAGTSYHHRASVKGVGCDCLGLLMGVFTEVTNIKVENPPPYTRTWADVAGSDILVDAVGRYMTSKDVKSVDAGDVVIFRLASNYVAKHAGIITSAHSMIHAQETVGVCEVSLNDWWRRRIAAAFEFPHLLNE